MTRKIKISDYLDADKRASMTKEELDSAPTIEEVYDLMKKNNKDDVVGL